MFNVDKASYVEAASITKSDELAKSARWINSPLDGKSVSHGPLDYMMINFYQEQPWNE